MQLATIRINKDKIPRRYSDNFTLRAEELVISVRVEGVGDKPFEVRLMVIDNILDINLGGAHVLGVVKGKRIPVKEFQEMSFTYPQPPQKFYSGTIVHQTNDVSIKRQINNKSSIPGQLCTKQTTPALNAKLTPCI